MSPTEDVSAVLAAHGYTGPSACARAREAIVREFQHAPVDSPEFEMSSTAVLRLSRVDYSSATPPSQSPRDVPAPPPPPRKAPQVPRIASLAAAAAPRAILFD